MKGRVNRQKGKLAVERMAVFLCLIIGAFHRDDYIPQLLADVVAVVQRKAQNVGRTVDAAVSRIQLFYLLVVDKSNGNFGAPLPVFAFKRRFYRLLDQRSLRRGQYQFLLRVSCINVEQVLCHNVRSCRFCRY